VTAGSPVRPLPSRGEARRLRGPSRLEVLHSRSDNSEVIIERALEGGVQRLRLDFAGLVMIDDAGLRCLRTTSQRCRESGAVFEVDAGGHVREAIAASGIEELADRPPDGGLT
jgi:ABC-type transporter Mla MlaB component